MANIARPVGEEDLQAWVDGRLTSERGEAVEAYLTAHPEERVRLSEYAEHRQALRAGFAEPGTPIPARLRVARLAASVQRRRRRRLVRIAAAILLFSLGGLAGWTVAGFSGSLGWNAASTARMIIADAVAAHRTFEVEVRHPVEVTATPQADLAEWLSDRLGRPLIIPDLTALGFRLIGGRLLPSEGGPAAQLMYDNDNGPGKRLTVYLRVGVSGDTTVYREDQDVGALYWADEGFACVILARRADRSALLRVAESLYAQLLPNAPKGEFARETGTRAD